MVDRHIVLCWDDVPLIQPVLGARTVFFTVFDRDDLVFGAVLGYLALRLLAGRATAIDVGLVGLSLQLLPLAVARQTHGDGS